MYVYSESVNRTYLYANDRRSHGREGGKDAETAHADEVAELLRIKKGSAYEVIRKINAEQEARGRVVIRGRVRSDVFDALYFPEVD